MLFSLMNIVGILILYQAMVFIVSMLFNKTAKPFFTKILILIFLTIILHFGYMLLANQGLVSQLLLGAFFGLIYGPLYYVYTKSLTIEALSLKRILSHFIPASLALLPIFLLEERLMHHIALVSILITFHICAYLILSLRSIYSYRKELLNTSSTFHRISLFWLEIIIYLQLTTIILAAFEGYFQAMINTDAFILIIYIFTLIIIHCFYFLGLKQVRLFRGFNEEQIGATPPSEYTIPGDLYSGYLKELKAFMKAEKPYLEYDITLQDLSEKLSISARNLSHVINKEFDQNFYSFINHYRLELAKKELSETEKPIKEIMYDSGFANKSTFFSIFKKTLGLTPLQYRNKHKI